MLSKEPWRENKGWVTHKIKSDYPFEIKLYLFFALFTSLVSYPILEFVFHEVTAGKYLTSILMFFPISAVVLIFLSIKHFVQKMQFGTIFFEMDPYPGSIGGNVGGKIQLKHLSKLIKESLTVELQLISVAKFGRNQESHSEIIEWNSKGHPHIVPIHQQNHQDEFIAKFSFKVPDELPESTYPKTGSHFYWRLQLTGDFSGAILKEKFIIPVFKTRQISGAEIPEINAKIETIIKETSQDELTRISHGEFKDTQVAKVLKFERTRNGTMLSTHMMRSPLLSLYAFIFFIMFFFASFMITRNFDIKITSSWFFLMFSIPFGLIALASCILFIHSTLVKQKVTFSNGNVAVISYLWFLPFYKIKFSQNEIQFIEVKKHGSTGQGLSKVEHYKIVANLKNKRKITFAEDIDTRERADALLKFMTSLSP